MSKLSAKRQREILADRHNIHNPHGLCAAVMEWFPDRKVVYVDYRPQETGRAFLSAAWQVVRPGFKTDPNSYWRDYGHKTFDVWRPGKDKEPKRLEAIAWASERYGFDPDEWVKTPFGSYMPASVLAPVLKELLADA